jgi:hypothetical protein
LGVFVVVVVVVFTSIQVSSKKNKITCSRHKEKNYL